MEDDEIENQPVQPDNDETLRGAGKVTKEPPASNQDGRWLSDPEAQYDGY